MSLWCLPWVPEWVLKEASKDVCSWGHCCMYGTVQSGTSMDIIIINAPMETSEMPLPARDILRRPYCTGKFGLSDLFHGSQANGIAMVT